MNRRSAKVNLLKQSGRCFLAVVFLACAARGSLAQDEIVHLFEIGPQVSYIEYEEPDIMDEKGLMYGIYGVYTFRMADRRVIESLKDILPGYNENKMFRLEGMFSYGWLDYDSDGSGSVDDLKDYMGEIRGAAGYDFPVSDAFQVTPYFGIGYRYLNDDGSGKTTSTGHVGYERESYYVYMPFGVETTIQMDNGWSWEAQVEYDLFLGGKQKSHLEDVSPALNTLENDQNEGYGIRGSVKLVKENASVDFVLEPFIKYWNVDESDIGVVTCGGTPCALGYEPENTSTEYGLKIGARF